MKTEIVKDEQVIVTTKQDIKKGGIALDNNLRKLTLEKLLNISNKNNK
jgi:hypothetical protein